MRLNTSHCSKCFIPATTTLWNDLPSAIVGAEELQKCTLGVNTILFDAVRLQSTFLSLFFKCFSIVLSSYFIKIIFVFLYENNFPFLYCGLSSCRGLNVFGLSGFVYLIKCKLHEIVWCECFCGEFQSIEL